MYTEFQELHTGEDHIVCVFVKKVDEGNVFIVGTVCRPPNSYISDFNNTMSNISEKADLQSCYIPGDYNLDLLNHD